MATGSFSDYARHKQGARRLHGVECVHVALEFVPPGGFVRVRITPMAGEACRA